MKEMTFFPFFNSMILKNGVREEDVPSNMKSQQWLKSLKQLAIYELFSSAQAGKKEFWNLV